MVMRYDSAFVVAAHASNPNVYDALMVMLGGTLTVVPQQGASVIFALPASAAGTAYPQIIPIATRLVTACPAGTVGLRF